MIAEIFSGSAGAGGGCCGAGGAEVGVCVALQLLEAFTESPAPEATDADGGGASASESLDDECWPDSVFGVADFGHDLSTRADVAGRVESEEGGHAFEPLLFGGFFTMQSDPGLEPAIASEFETHTGAGECG